jgi:hypothetical protein
MSEQAPVLGQDNDERALAYPSEYREVLAQMLAQGKNSVLVFAYDLEPQVYEHFAFYEGLRQIALAHQRSHVRVLLQNPKSMATRGSRLLEMSRRMSSSVEIRKPSRDFIERKDSFVVVDGVGFVYRPIYSMYEGLVDFYNPGKARKLSEQFNEMWNSASRNIDLLRLHI